MFCNKCGAQIENGEAFCKKCGARAVDESKIKGVTKPRKEYKISVYNILWLFPNPLLPCNDFYAGFTKAGLIRFAAIILGMIFCGINLMIGMIFICASVFWSLVELVLINKSVDIKDGNRTIYITNKLEILYDKKGVQESIRRQCGINIKL